MQSQRSGYFGTALRKVLWGLRFFSFKHLFSVLVLSFFFLLVSPMMNQHSFLRHMAGYIFTHFFFDNNHFARIITAIQVQSQILVSNTSNAVSLLFSSSSSFTQTSSHQQQHPATSTGNISVPCFLYTFCTFSNSISGLPSLAPSVCSQSSRIGSGIRLFPPFPIRPHSSEEISSLAPATPPFPTNPRARLLAANLSNLETFSQIISGLMRLKLKSSWTVN